MGYTVKLRTEQQASNSFLLAVGRFSVKNTDQKPSLAQNEMEKCEMGCGSVLHEDEKCAYGTRKC